MTRLIRIDHENGKYSCEAEIESGTMVNRGGFSSWMLGQGNFLWKGTQSDLEKVWEFELENDAGKVIYRPDHIGWISGEGLWLFGDCAIHNGQVIAPGEEEIVWIGEKGYQPITLEVGRDEKGRAAESMLMPILDWRISDTVVDRIRKDLIRLLKENLGGYQAYLGLGFIGACAYYEELFREFKFPILFLFGRRQCGKNTLANLLMAHFGMGEDTADNITSITKAALARKLAYYSSIPVWVDEYRSGDPECQKKDSILRSAFDRVGGSKGTLSSAIVTYKVRAPLIITGESFPSDSALTSRCVMVQLSEAKRNDALYQDIRKLIPSLSAIFCKLTREKTPEKAKRFIEVVREAKDELESKGMDPRLSGMLAVLGEGFMEIYNPEDVNDDAIEFGDWLHKEADKAKREKEEKLLTNEFLSDVEVLRSRGLINGDHVELRGIRNNGEFELQEVYVWLKGIFNCWEEDRRRRGLASWSFGDVQKYFREEPYFVSDHEVKRINKRVRRAMILKSEHMPEEIQNIFISGWADC
jgi:hypothetical protein